MFDVRIIPNPFKRDGEQGAGISNIKDGSSCNYRYD
jgi:hypothetical protein